MSDPSNKDANISAIQDQYLSFTLYKENYAFPVSLIKEVIEKSTYTPIPRTIDYMRGIYNLRGSVIPIIDLRPLFKLSKPDDYVDSPTSDIIILEVPNYENNALVGILADQIEEVINLPRSLTSLDHELTVNNFILKIGKKNDHFILILDIQKIINFISGEVNSKASNE